jgi:hypothetical protein
MNVVVTLLISADMKTTPGDDGQPHTEIKLGNVANQVMATVIPLGGAAETTKEFRNACATEIVRAGLQFMINDMKGEHATPVPKTNSPGADA